MNAQFKFFNSDKFSEAGRPVMAGLNYFLTHEARGGDGSGLLGEKKDVKAWLGWLELYANGDVESIDSPIGFIPKYEDLKKLFSGIDKEYPKNLYDMQFSLYIDKIIARIDTQTDAYSKEQNLPLQLFGIYEAQKSALLALKEKYGSVIAVEQLMEATVV
jgi:phosphoenolpyruvate carboxykinase (GTP)